MTTNTKSESPFWGNSKNRTPKETKSETTNKLCEMRQAYFDALAEGRTAGNLSDEELLSELQWMTEQTTGVFTEAFGTVFTPEERKRLSGVGVSKHGFINMYLEKAREMTSLICPCG